MSGGLASGLNTVVYSQLMCLAQQRTDSDSCM